MPKIGLKLWSTNLKYMPAARDLFERKMFDYIELFTVLGSQETISQWKELGIPFVLHAPHSTAGLNPADRDQREANIESVRQLARFFDALSPAFVIFHPGVGGGIEESILQFRSFGERFPLMYQKIIIENKPLVGLRDEKCLGASPEEMLFLLDGTGRGLCLDFGHAICYSVAAAKDWKAVVADFLAMRPAMYHFCDGLFSVKDDHRHLGTGKFDLPYLFGLIERDKRITLETNKDHSELLDDFLQDVQRLRVYAGN